MIIFSLILFPAAALWFAAGKPAGTGQTGLKSFYSMIPYYFLSFFLQGAAAVIPALFILLFFKSFISITNSHINIYLYNYINDFLFCHLVSLAGYKYFFRNIYHVNHVDRIKQSFIYFSGFFTAYMIIVLAMRFSMPDPYPAFFLPAAWLALAGYSAVLLSMQEDEAGVMRTLYIALLFAAPFFIALVPFFYYINMIAVSIFLLAVLIAGSFVLLLRAAGESFT